MTKTILVSFLVLLGGKAQAGTFDFVDKILADQVNCSNTWDALQEGRKFRALYVEARDDYAEGKSSAVEIMDSSPKSSMTLKKGTHQCTITNGEECNMYFCEELK